MNQLANWLVWLIRPPLVFLWYLLTPLYRITFGLLDKRLARRYERQLAVDVQFALAFLFKEHGARIIPNEGVPFPPGFDYAFVTLAAENFCLRFTRGRGELGVLLAPAFAPSDWHDLSLVLGVITGATSLQRHFYRDVWQVSRALQPHIDTLIKSCSPDEFKALRRQLQVEFYSQEQFAIRQWESEINARLYGPKK